MIQSHAGPHPNASARIGPTIGPAPAIEAKWWAKTTWLGVLTYSFPSANRTDGGGLASFWSKTLAIQNG